MKKRIKYLDELRIYAILNIILLHVIGLFFYKYYGISTPKYAFMAFLSSFTRVGIPLFFMITGVLMLTKKEEPYSAYLKKRVMRLVKAYVFFSFIYYIYHIITKVENLNIFELIRKITSFYVEYHLWFMPVIILIYIFIPFIKKFVNSLEKEELKRCIFMIWIFSNLFIGIEAISSRFGYAIMSSFMLPNLIGYTNYLLVGYYLGSSNYKISKKLTILAILSILCIPLLTVFVSKNELNDVFLNSLSPLVIAPSIWTFLFFKNKKISFPEKINNWISNYSEKVFYVYLIHVLFICIIEKYYNTWIQKTSFIQDIGLILLIWFIVTILSFMFAYLYTTLKQGIEKYKEKIKNVLIHLLTYFLIIVFIIILGSIIINPYHFIKINYGLTIIGILLWIGIFYLFYRYQNRLFKNKIINGILILLYITLQIIIGYCFMVKPTWDFGEVFNIAVNFAKSSHPIFGAPYLYNCDNNIMITAILDIIFKIFYTLGIKNHFIELGILLNIIMIDLSILYTYRLLKKMNVHLARPFLLFVLFSSPLLFYIPIFYTDTLSLPFMIMALYYFYQYVYAKQRIREIIIAGILIGIGGIIKPTVLIFGIAIILFLFIRKQKIDLYQFLPIFVVAISLPLLGQRIFINHFFVKSYIEDYRIPTSHYLLIGLENNGEYNEQRYKEINQIEGKEEKEKQTKAKIKKRIEEIIEKKQVFSFYHRKLSYTWSDGTFFSFEKLHREPIHEKFTKYVYSNKNYDILYWTFSNSEWIIIVVLIIIGMIFRKYLPEKIQDISILINISTIGILLFLLIWETRSRYLINFIPFFMLNAFIGMYACKNYIETKKEGKK